MSQSSTFLEDSNQVITPEAMETQATWGISDTAAAQAAYQDFLVEEYEHYLHNALLVLEKRFNETTGEHITSNAHQLFKELKFWQNNSYFVWPQIFITDYGDVEFFWKARKNNLSITRISENDTHTQYAVRIWIDGEELPNETYSAGKLIGKMGEAYAIIVQMVNATSKGAWKEILKSRYESCDA